MNIFIDCEFNGFGGDLLSMALVSDDGQEFYEVLNLEHDFVYVDWVKENVVPILNKAPIDKQSFQHKLSLFINQYNDVTVIADWPDDIKYFCDSLIVSPGVSIRTPESLYLRIDRELSSKDSLIPHNALEDARAIKKYYHKLKKELYGYNIY
jgi:hypothetical protein